jgi:hypothetical protein
MLFKINNHDESPMSTPFDGLRVFTSIVAGRNPPASTQRAPHVTSNPEKKARLSAEYAPPFDLLPTTHHLYMYCALQAKVSTTTTTTQKLGK